MEPLKLHSLERIGRGGARKSWLRSAPRRSFFPFPSPAPKCGEKVAGSNRRRGAEELVAGGGRWGAARVEVAGRRQ